MKVNSRQQLLAIIAIAAVVLWAGLNMIYNPLAKSWKARAARIAQLKKSVDQGSKVLEREKVIRERWDQMRTNTLANVLSEGESQVFKSFDRWSRDSGVTVNSIKPQWKRNEDDYMTLECRADAAGNLATLTRFLYEIEKDPLALKVDSVELSARDSRGQQLTLGLTVSGLLLNPPPAP
jgi:Tfp pilus assembly protein PilO